MAENTVMDVVLDTEEELTRDRFETALSEELASEVRDSRAGRAGNPFRFGEQINAPVGDTAGLRFGDGPPLKFGDGPAVGA
jgi:hypothetical protein